MFYPKEIIPFVFAYDPNETIVARPANPSGCAQLEIFVYRKNSRIGLPSQDEVVLRY